MTGSPNIRPETGKRFTERTTNPSVCPSGGYIVRYLCARLDENGRPHIKDESLEVDILENIPENISEMEVGGIALGAPPHVIG